MAGPEAGLRARILAAIRRDYPQSTSGVIIFGRPASGSTGPGHPDLFGCALGRFFGLEIKTADGKPTPLQLDRIRLLRRAGGYVWIVRSELAALKAVFNVKQGGTHPMPEEPIDFDDWLKGINTPAAAPAEEPTVIDVPAVEPSVENLDDLFQAPPQTHEEKLADLDARGEALDAEPEQPSAADVIASLPQPATEQAADFFESVAPAIAAVNDTPLEELPSFEDAPRRPTVEEVQHALSIQAEADADQNLAALQGDIRSVGERVSMVWDLVNELAGLQVMLINEMRQLRHDFDQAMAEEDDEIPDPVLMPAWTKPVTLLPTDPEPSGLGTTKPQRRGRRRQAAS